MKYCTVVLHKLSAAKVERDITGGVKISTGQSMSAGGCKVDTEGGETPSGLLSNELKGGDLGSGSLKGRSPKKQARLHKTLADHSDPASLPLAVALPEVVVHEISCEEAGEGISAFAGVTKAQARLHETVADHSDPSSFPPDVALPEVVVHEISCEEAGEGISASAAVTEAQVWPSQMDVSLGGDGGTPACSSAVAVCNVVHETSCQQAGDAASTSASMMEAQCHLLHVQVVEDAQLDTEARRVHSPDFDPASVAEHLSRKELMIRALEPAALDENIGQKIISIEEGLQITVKSSRQEFPTTSEKEFSSHLPNSVEIDHYLHRKVSNSKRPARPCPYCGLFRNKLARHVRSMHGDLVEVDDMKKMSPKKRSIEMKKIRNRGIFNHYLNNPDEKLVLRKNASIKRSRICIRCKGFFATRYFSSHKCVEDGSGKATGIKAHVLRAANTDENFAKEIASRFRNDEIGLLCTSDPIIMSLGHQQFKSLQCSFKRIEARGRTMKYMRLIARLLVNFRASAAKDGKLLDTHDLFRRIYFPYLVKAIENVSKVDNKTKHGLKIALGYAIKEAALALQGMFLISEEDKKADEITKFLSILTMKWGEIFRSSEYASKKKREEVLRRPSRLPDMAKMEAVKEHINGRLKVLTGASAITASDYLEIRRLIVCRLVFFNGRRVSEPCRITIKEREETFEGVWLDERAIFRMCSDEERQLIDSFYIAYISAKNTSSVVDLIIPKDLKRPIQILMSEENRRKAGIHPDNKFVFANIRNSKDHVCGWRDVDTVIKDSKIGRVTSTDIRHHLSTLFAETEQAETVRSLFSQHLGHSDNINRSVYQAPPAVRTLLGVGRFLQNADSGMCNAGTSKAGSAILPNARDNSVRELPPSRVVATSKVSTTTTTEEELDSTDDSNNSHTTEVSSAVYCTPVKRARQTPVKLARQTPVKLARPTPCSETPKAKSGRRYVTWTKEDTAKVKSFFANHIRGKKVPLRTADILKFINEEDTVTLRGFKVQRQASFLRSKICNEKKTYLMSK
ncbi:uncharacterized protein LOC125178653 [Hyalella azteca]|uniref:Uncharacterized protein LOC125178653 n=1 Tax=Hyalella azteca TaxID=294128 RepID=A0A979FP74_HYAAZ|nr:uncharacterized protein LOC125178653 [Hyalella azteca]